MTPEQQKIVEANMGLVGKVIKEKVRRLGQPGTPSYEDLFQTGCVGLCKAAMTDKGGCFSTYAYRLIWNEICDELIRNTRLVLNEQSTDAVVPARSAVPKGFWGSESYRHSTSHTAPALSAPAFRCCFLHR